MRNDKKGCYLKIYQAPTGGRNDYAVEIGTDFDACRIAVDFADLVTIKNEIIKIEERAKEREKEC